jgi:hypothetical protein
MVFEEELVVVKTTFEETIFTFKENKLSLVLITAYSVA